MCAAQQKTLQANSSSNNIGVILSGKLNGVMPQKARTWKHQAVIITLRECLIVIP